MAGIRLANPEPASVPAGAIFVVGEEFRKQLERVQQVGDASAVARIRIGSDIFETLLRPMQ